MRMGRDGRIKGGKGVRERKEGRVEDGEREGKGLRVG